MRYRHGEIEKAAIMQVYAVSDPSETSDPEYMEGLPAAVSAALDYAIASLEQEEGQPLPIPTTLLSQARLAARNQVGLDTVLRRYFVGYTLLSNFVIEEAERGERFAAGDLQKLLRSQAALFDRVVVTVTEEYTSEVKRRLVSAGRGRAERVERVLDGELADLAEPGYELDGYHLGATASGNGAADILRNLSRELDRRILLVPRENETLWAWLGGKDALECTEAEHVCSCELPPGVSLAIGEPGEGLAGWRMTHRQAKAAQSVGSHVANRPVRYADVAILAAALRDDLLTHSLRQLYLDPLTELRNGSEPSWETLRAYFACGGNVSSAAALLGVKRHTITRRLRAIEDCIGRSLSVCLPELHVALRLAQFDE